MATPDFNGDSTAFVGGAPVGRPSRLRTIALGILVGSLLTVGGIVALLAISRRETLPPITMADLAAAAQRWADNGPADYDLDLQQTGVNPGLIHVEVRRGQVTAMTLNGRPTRQHLWDDWSVPGILAIIRRDVEVCMPELNAKARGQSDTGAQNPAASQDAMPPILPRGLFDPHDGHPLQYHRITPTGADANWRVVMFVPK